MKNISKEKCIDDKRVDTDANRSDPSGRFSLLDLHSLNRFKTLKRVLTEYKVLYADPQSEQERSHTSASGETGKEL